MPAGDGDGDGEGDTDPAVSSPFLPTTRATVMQTSRCGARDVGGWYVDHDNDPETPLLVTYLGSEEGDIPTPLMPANKLRSFASL